MPFNDPTTESELNRVRAEYANRAERFSRTDIYSPLNPAYLFAVHHRQKVMAQMLIQAGYTSLRDLRILEIGCGGGDVLHELMAYRLSSNALHGMDLIPERVHSAKRRFPFLPLLVADAQHLPYASKSIDLVMQSMVFSSVLNEKVRMNIAYEMVRVLRPNGSIIWYDFWINPLNPQTRGIHPAEVRQLFKGCECTFKRITLAPPLARRVVPFSRLIAEILESLKLLNTHYIAIIRPQC